MDEPQFNVEMEKFTGEDVTIHYNRESGGLWIDPADLNKLLLHHNLPGLESMGGKPDTDEEAGRCPTDDDYMIAVFGGPKHSFSYETCEICGGVWLWAEDDVNSFKDAAEEVVSFFKDFRRSS